MEIVNVEFGKEYDEIAKAWDRVIVTIRGKNDEKIDINVELFHGRYRPDLGSVITTGFGEILEKEDLEDYDTELEMIIKAAEDYSASVYRIRPISGIQNYVLKIFREKVVLTEVKRNTITNKDKLIDIKSFEPIKEAKEFLEGLLKYKQEILK